MHTLQSLDIHNAAVEVYDLAFALGRMLDHLANSAPDPFSAQLTVAAAACELLSDKAIIIQDNAK